MRRRFLLALGGGGAVLTGCNARESGAADPSPGGRESADDPRGTGATTASETARIDRSGRAVRRARERLAVAFDELREMRPVGTDEIRVSEDRFAASDHSAVERRVADARRALDAAEAGARTAETRTAVERLRHAVDLARAGRRLYGAVRRGFRSEWRFEYHFYYAEWDAAATYARQSGRAISAWSARGEAVTDAAEAVRAADQTGPASVPRLDIDAWRRDGAVLRSVSGPLEDVIGGLRGYCAAIQSDDAGLAALDADRYEAARERFVAAVGSVREAHRRLTRAKADGAQGFQSYAAPVRGRCEPAREAYALHLAAARAASDGETDRSETLRARGMERLSAAAADHPLPVPETGREEGETDRSRLSRPRGRASRGTSR